MNTEELDPTIPTFADLAIDERVLQALSDVGYESPSPIQAATIPPLMAGRDVVGLAQTGTGKTAAFALPILSRLDLAKRKPQALVLAPTRELALQVSEAFESYANHIDNLHILPIYGGQSYTVQLNGLRRGVHVVVGTPGRIIDHLERGTLDLSQLSYLVLDEADEMLKMGFQEAVESILSRTPERKQVALFSATMPTAIRKISQQYLNNPEEIFVRAKTQTASNIGQRYLLVAQSRKLEAMTRILEVESFAAMIIFVRTKQSTEELAEKLRARGFSAQAINGDIVQAQRERSINGLKSGSIDILVATDVAARGLDVDRISHVVNYDIPHDTEAYIHRIGRTGRAGRAGQALLFVTPRERYLLKSIERTTRQPLEEMQLPSVDAVNAQRIAKFADSITESLAGENLETFRSMIEDYVREHDDIPLLDIAAALAAQSRDVDNFFMSSDGDDRLLDSGDRRRGREDRRSSSRSRGKPMLTYRISVGKRHKVAPGAIVGAIANEGGLSSSDIGNISIRPDFSLVELSVDLPEEALHSLRNTLIAGQLIQLQVDSGPPSGRQRHRRGERNTRKRVAGRYGSHHNS